MEWIGRVLWVLFISTASALDFSISHLAESPGLYYEHKGEAQLYNSEWKVLNYINLKELENKYNVMIKYLDNTIGLCKKHGNSSWANITDCMSLQESVKNKLKDIDDTKSLIRQLARGTEGPLRMKRGVFNFIGEVSKILFGTMDEDDAEYYTEKINQLEDEQGGLLKLTKEQLTVVKSTLKAVNSTIKEIKDNEDTLSRGLDEISLHINKEDGEVKKMFGLVSIMVAVNKHMIQLNRIIDETRETYELILNAIVNAQKGILQPHIITPAQILENLKASRISIPKDLFLPFPISVTFGTALLKVIDFDVFINNDILAYVIRIPLTDNLKFNVYNVLPLPISISSNNSKFIFIQPEKEYLLMDLTKQFYCKIDKMEFNAYKKINVYWRLCKQSYPLKSTHFHEECEARMLQPIRKIPQDCSQRIVQLNQTLCTQLDNNEWHFIAPKSESMTILCPDQDPSDFLISGTGKLKLIKKCKCYGSNVMIQAQVVINSNNTNKDIVPPLSLKYDCCEDEGYKINVEKLTLVTPLKHVINNMGDLNYASHKVKEIEKMVSEEEWKLKHYSKVHHLSFLTYIALIVLSMLIFCSCCKLCWPKLWKLWKNSSCDSCTTIVFKPKIVNKVHTSNEGLQVNPSEEDIEGVELTSMCFLPSPKTDRRPSIVRASSPSNRR